MNAQLIKSELTATTKTATRPALMNFIQLLIHRGKPWVLFVIIGILSIVAIQDRYKIGNLETAVVSLQYGHPP